MLTHTHATGASAWTRAHDARVPRGPSAEHLSLEDIRHLALRVTCVWGLYVPMYEVCVHVDNTAGSYTKGLTKGWSPAVLHPAESTSIALMAQGHTSAHRDWLPGAPGGAKKLKGLFLNPWQFVSLGTQAKSGNVAHWQLLFTARCVGRAAEPGHRLRWVLCTSNPLPCMLRTPLGLFP